MSSKEEQLMELEVLESLFPVEFLKISETEFQFNNLLPYSDNSRPNHVSVSLTFRYPDAYPESESVLVEVTKTTGCISTDSSRLEELMLVISEVSEENLGSSCVYQIGDRVQDWLRQHNHEERSLHDLMQGRTGAKPARVSRHRVEESDSDDEDDSDYSEDEYSDDDSDDDEYDSESDEDEDEFVGLQQRQLCPESERITTPEFLAWKLEYDQHLLAAGLIKRIAPGDTRQTGKEQFLQTLVSRSDANGGPVVGGMEFNEDLFVDECDFDETELQ